jgi:hypothetical protein
MKIPTQARYDVYVRDGSRCARCDASVVNIPSSLHHRLPRRMGGTSDPRSYDSRNLVLVCGTGTTGCHGEIESYRALSYDTGWLIRSYAELDTPLLSKDGRRVYLYGNGDRDDVIDADSILAASVMT